MLKIENIDLEFPTIGKTPSFGFSDEFVEKTMMSGKIKRIYKGRRFYATFSYGYLLDEQRAIIDELLQTQRVKGALVVKCTTPYGEFDGDAILELNNNQARYLYSDVLKDYVWTNWTLTLKAVSYVD